MATYIIGWPDSSWSVYVSARSASLEQVWDAIDASADPGIASVFRVKKEGGRDCYLEIPPSGDPAGIPLQHWGELEPMQLKPPYDAVWREYLDAVAELLPEGGTNDPSDR